MFAAIVLAGLAVLASAPAVPAQPADLPSGWVRAAGQAWMDELRLEVFGTDVATTDALALPKRPNLSFEP